MTEAPVSRSIIDRMRKLVQELTGLIQAHDYVQSQRIQHGNAKPLRDQEREIILRALQLSGWNCQAAAKQLGIGRQTLYNRMKKHAIPKARQYRFLKA